METSHVILLLIELHKSIFQHAILNARGKTEIPLFSIQAPGNIGVDKIEVPNINLDPNSLPDDIKSQIVKIFSTSQIGKNYPLERNGIKPGVFDSFLNGIRHTHLLSVVSNPLNHYQAFLLHAENHSRCLAEWLESGTTSRFIQVIIQPEINVGEFTSFGQWESYLLSPPERCIEGYQGFQSEQEAAERVFSSSFFRRDMKSMPTSADDILTEVDILSLSLWRALGNVYRIQDIRFERRPWQFSPDDDLPLGIKYQMLWDNPRENMQLQTFVRFNDHKVSGFGSPLTRDYYDRVLKWVDMLSANRKAIYSLNMICDGFRDIARSVGEQSFRKNKIARDGIIKTISGLEGLNSECKPLHPNSGHKLKATETFIDCWGKIWEKALSRDPPNAYLSKAPDIGAALRNIYDLRSDLAHSDPTLMKFSLMHTKQSWTAPLWLDSAG